MVNGLLISFTADIVACSMSFYLSRNFGRKLLKKLMPKKFLNKFENISKNYLEKNFFLLTGFLMTGWFDFVSYGVGLTKLKWKKFLPSLILSAFLSDLPFVATGNGFKQIQNSNYNLRDILEGNLPTLQKEYLIIFIISALLIFIIGIVGAFINNKYINAHDDLKAK